MFISVKKNSVIFLIAHIGRLCLCFLLLCCIISSCNKQNSDSGTYSEAFKPVFDKATHYLDFNQPARGIYYLDSAFARINKPYLNDRFRFYSFHFVYQQK